MERNRTKRLPWAIALLIVIFACVTAFLGARILSGVTRRSSYDYRSVSIPSNLQLEVSDDGFIYYDGSSIASVTTEARVKWSYLIGPNATFHGTDFGIAAWVGQKLMLIDSTSGTSSFTGDMEAEVLSARMISL